VPTEEKVIRKLRAILSADVKGYSLLMSDNEAFTVKTLKSYRALMYEQIEQNTGRVIDSPGDNLLAEFSSAVDAVVCAVEIQQILQDKNEDLPIERRLEFRIGVNIGDVIQDGGSLYGEGVNIAARIEGLADPGGVCISRNAYDHISNKLNFGYEYLGEHTVKNIEKPIRVYKVLKDPQDAGKLIGEKPKAPTRKWIWPAIVATVLILAFFVWYNFQNETVLSEKPSIAVLPFDNMTSDPKQEYFSDGITEDIITELSKISGLLVISRNSTFTYKDKELKIPEIAEELNVRYVLEGSVRRDADHVRINAQLIDAKTDHHIWADKFDGKMENIFQLQDWITEKIVSELSIALSIDEKKALADRGTKNQLAYDAYIKGKFHLSQTTADDHLKAIEYLKKAVNIDPNFSRGYATLGLAYQSGSNLGFLAQVGINPSEARLKASHNLGLSMKNPVSDTYLLSGNIEMHRRHYENALADFQKALKLAPNDISVYLGIGWALIANGKYEQAIEYLQKGKQIDPLYPLSIGTIQCLIGMAYFCLEDDKQCINYIQNAQKYYPGLRRFLCFSAASHAHLGRGEEAAINLKQYLKNVPPLMQVVYYSWPFKNIEIFDRLASGLLLAGFPVDGAEYVKIIDDNKLSPEKIREIVYGNKMVGEFWGGEWSRRYKKSGSFQLRKTFNNELGIEWYDEFYDYKNGDRYIEINAEAWIENNMNCWQSNDQFNGLKICEDLYFNSEGSSKNKNEYIGLDDLGMFYFSIEM